MRFHIDANPANLARYVGPFFDLVGRQDWFKRAERLADEQRKSPFQWKIVRDYHWLELVIAHQGEVMEKTGELAAERLDVLDMAGLHFAAAVVELHSRLSTRGRRVLVGRLRDGLRAENGFAPLYLELDEAQRLMSAGYEVSFPDMEGSGRADIEFEHDGVSAQVECKSLSVDAGRKIHRKDFYRLMEVIRPEIETHAAGARAGVIVVSLRDRLSANVVEQRELRRALKDALGGEGDLKLQTPGFTIDRYCYDACLSGAPADTEKEFHNAVEQRFGAACHVVGGSHENGGGCFVVMRSEREDDTSKPLLEAMRKAADQLSAESPSFIVVQFQDIEPADLLLAQLRRRMAVLSYALFGHYGAEHVNGAYFCGYGAAVVRDGVMGTPGFGVPNPRAKFPLKPEAALPYLGHIPDADFAEAIGAPPPLEDISNLKL